MGKLIERIKNHQENVLIVALSLALTVNSLLFIAREVEQIGFLKLTPSPLPFYFLYAVLTAALLATLRHFNKKVYDKKIVAGRILLAYLGTAILLSYGISESKHFHYAFELATGLYVIALGSFLICSRKFKWRKKVSYAPSFFRNWLKLQGKTAMALVLLVMATNLVFGTHRLAEFGAVDEPLWTFERIPQFWNNLTERDWNGTRVSDKPGVTVAIISGAGLLFEDPKPYKKYYKAGEVDSNPYDIRNLNFALRFPILLFTVLMLPLFYFLLERLLGKSTALYATILIGLSPILIGMSSIINPDSILWVFAPLSLLSFLNYTKSRHPAYLYLAGILLGLSLLTKYVANILFIFFLGYLFIEYIFHKKDYANLTTRRYLKESLTDYLILIFVSLATFYLLYPAVWVKPERLFSGTVLSQAFTSTWPIFASFFALLLFDMLTLKSRIFSVFLDFLAKYKKVLATSLSALFLLCVAFAFANVYLGMKWYDFEAVIASPKTAYGTGGYDGLFIANFFPLIFTIIPLAFISLFFAVVYGILKMESLSEKRIGSVIFAIILFILLYYSATTVNQVAAMNRYQIMIFPLAMVLGGIGLGIAHSLFGKKYEKIGYVPYLVVFVIATSSLFFSRPFHISYDSSLLPEKYYTDLKDMGTGSYEAAEFINSLPEADSLKVWVDKRGVCSFLKAKCLSGLTYPKLREEGFDYAVVSAGRESRTGKLIEAHISANKKGVVRFDSLYLKNDDDVVFKLEINGRPRNFIKVIKIDEEFFNL